MFFKKFFKNDQWRVVHCKKSLMKSTYHALAFKKGHTYVVAGNTEAKDKLGKFDITLVIDERGNEFTFMTVDNPERTMYSFSEYFRDPR